MGAEFGTVPNGLAMLLQMKWAFDADARYLCPAPLYHAAPLGWTTAVQRIGATVIVMERFDPAGVLETVERRQVTHAQFVPTHFVRMLRLEEAERQRHDLSRPKAVIHAAAPCPVEVKEQMLDWWGPIIHEYYAGSEANGFVAITPEEWMDHKGSVGKPVLGVIHILDEDGNEVPTGEPGSVWFESPAVFEYHKDSEKTRSAFNDKGWSTLGDVGYVDDEGYLYLTDRKSHMIISGGVNIYPQEVENLLSVHPDVADVAVIGVPDPEMGEQVKAVVQLVDPGKSGAETADALIAYCREHISHYKCPRSIDFVDDLPRLPTGKLRKGEIRKQYWPA